VWHGPIGAACRDGSDTGIPVVDTVPAFTGRNSVSCAGRPKSASIPNLRAFRGLVVGAVGLEPTAR